MSWRTLVVPTRNRSVVSPSGPSHARWTRFDFSLTQLASFGSARIGVARSFVGRRSERGTAKCGAPYGIINDGL